MLHFLKHQDDTYSPFNCKRSFSTLIFNLGSVEEMREDDPGQDLQRRLENPVPSSVASKHLRRRIRQNFDFFILTFEPGTLTINKCVGQKFASKQSALGIVHLDIMITFSIVNLQAGNYDYFWQSGGSPSVPFLI